MRLIRFRRLSPSMVVACLALLVALGGTSYAALRLPANSVGTAQLKNGAVTSVKVKAGSLLKRDFKPGQLPAGPAGPGAKWALVKGDGTIVAQSGGITLTSKPKAGEYILDFGSTITGHLIIASSGLASDLTFRGTVSAAPCGGTGEGVTCPSGNDTNHVVVFTDNPGETATQDHAFYVAVI